MGEPIGNGDFLVRNPQGDCVAQFDFAPGTDIEVRDILRNTLMSYYDQSREIDRLKSDIEKMKSIIGNLYFQLFELKGRDFEI